MTHMPEARTHTETFDCDGPAAAAAGRIDVRLANVPYVRVTVSQERAAHGDAEPQLVSDTKIEFSQERRRLVVRPLRSLRRSPLALLVEAPLRSKVTTRAHRGPATISGEASSLNAATGAGELSAGEVDGSADLRTGRGDIKVGRVRGRLRARTGAGDVEVASIDGEGGTLATGRGDVWLGVVRGDVQARTGNGSLEVAEAGSGRVELATGAGDVRVAIRPGVAAELDVSSDYGEARSELEVSDRPPANAPLLRIRARTRTGDVLVRTLD
jgi:hypothetical protein